jgi:hypothetical protein
MLKNATAYRRRAARRWSVLAQKTPEETIAIGEALLTSEIMAVARFPRRRPKCLAVALGIRRRSR